VARGVLALAKVVVLCAIPASMARPDGERLSLDFRFKVEDDPSQGFRGAVGGDARGDGVSRLVCGDCVGRIYVFNFTDGKYTLEWRSPEKQQDVCVCPKAIGDADNDGKPEILVDMYVATGPSVGHYLCMYEWLPKEGTYGLSHKQFISSGSFLPMTIADLDVDGKDEVLLTDPNFAVYRYNGSQFVRIWSCSTGQTLQISVGDADGDGRMEGVCTNPLSSPGRVFVLGFDGSTYTREAEFEISPNNVGSASVGEIDGDGADEILAATYNIAVPPSDYLVYKAEWVGGGYVTDRIGTIGCGTYDIHFGDTDGDGASEALILCNFGVQRLLDYESGDYILLNATIGSTGQFGDLSDVDADGRPELIIPTYDGLFVFSDLKVSPQPVPEPAAISMAVFLLFFLVPDREAHRSGRGAT